MTVRTAIGSVNCFAVEWVAQMAASCKTLRVKRVLFLVGGFCWLAFAAGIAMFVVSYLMSGAGRQELPWFFGISLGSVALGMLHLIGLCLLSGLCALIGLALLLRALVPRRGV